MSEDKRSKGSVMNRLQSCWKIEFAFALTLLMIAFGAWFGGGEGGRHPVVGSISKTADLEPTGSAQLVSVEPLQETDGQMCEWTPASASTGMWKL